MKPRLMLLVVATVIGFVLANHVSSSVPRVRAEVAFPQAGAACGAPTTLFLFLPAVFSNQSSLALNGSDTMRPAGSEQVAYADFNCDGYADLAVGVVGEAVDGFDDAGMVNVLYGSAAGVAAANNQAWHQNVTEPVAVAGSAEAGDWFGYALTAGDFDGDGYSDLAIGIPFEDVDGVANAGAVQLLYGSAAGLAPKHVQIWHQNDEGIEGAAEADDRFGDELTAGDFDGDGYADLAIGIPYENVDSIANAGAVQLLYGSAAGLAPKHTQIWHQDDDGMEGAAEAEDRFGHALTTADFDKDGYADLAIGVPYEDIETIVNAGAIQVLYGAGSGVGPKHPQTWHQDDEGIEGAAEAEDRFGYALTAADFDGDGYDDLAVGVPFEDIDSVVNAGAVQLLYGSATGVVPKHAQIWHQDDDGMEGTAETEDQFGHALTAADFDGDGFDDLAIGVPRENIGTVINTGAVQLLYGSSAGVVPKHAQIWHQDDDGMEGAAEANDSFGHALTAADFDGDGYADLAIGVPFENIGSILNAGAAQLIYGAGGGLAPKHPQIWHQDVVGILGGAEADDVFGYSLAARN